VFMQKLADKPRKEPLSKYACEAIKLGARIQDNEIIYLLTLERAIFYTGRNVSPNLRPMDPSLENFMIILSCTGDA